MDEVVELENRISEALINDRVPDKTLPWAHEVLCNSHTGPDTRLARLRTIVAEINRVPMDGIRSGGKSFP